MKVKLADSNVEKIYNDYLQKAKNLQKEGGKKYLPFGIIGLVLMGCGFTSFFWAGFRTASTLMFWGIILSIVIALIGAGIQNQWMKGEVESLSRNYPGFTEFSKELRRGLYFKKNPEGNRRETLLSIIKSNMKTK